MALYLEVNLAEKSWELATLVGSYTYWPYFLLILLLLPLTVLEDGLPLPLHQLDLLLHVRHL
jgi:hypothetical protein